MHMKIKTIKLFSVLLTLCIFFTISIPVYAGDMKPVNTGSNVQIVNIDISQLPRFDINNYNEYRPLFEQYGVDVDKIFAIIPMEGSALQSQENALQSENVTSSSSTSVPAGILVLTGTYLSDYTWKLTVLNMGILNVYNMEADVILINSSYGPVLNTQRVLGGLSKFGSLSETFSAGGYTIDVAIVTVTGITEQGDYFSMGGTDYR